MQDIAGCRVVVTDVVKQEQFIASLRTVFPEAAVIDHRDNPSCDYRAVHIIAGLLNKMVTWLDEKAKEQDRKSGTFTCIFLDFPHPDNEGLDS